MLPKPGIEPQPGLSPKEKKRTAATNGFRERTSFRPGQITPLVSGLRKRHKLPVRIVRGDQGFLGLVGWCLPA